MFVSVTADFKAFLSFIKSDNISNCMNSGP